MKSYNDINEQIYSILCKEAHMYHKQINKGLHPGYKYQCNIMRYFGKNSQSKLTEKERETELPRAIYAGY